MGKDTPRALHTEPHPLGASRGHSHSGDWRQDFLSAGHMASPV